MCVQMRRWRVTCLSAFEAAGTFSRSTSAKRPSTWYVVVTVTPCTRYARVCIGNQTLQVRELLETATHEKPISVALDVLSIYLRCYGASIRDGCQQDDLHDVEVQAWRDRCLACRTALQGLAPLLAAVQRAHQDGHLGSKAQELQQEAACLS